MTNSPTLKQIRTEKYINWRILSSCHVWAEQYLRHIKKLKEYKSAILFPEQLTLMQNQPKYEVEIQQGSFSISSTLSMRRDFTPLVRQATEETPSSLVNIWNKTNLELPTSPHWFIEYEYHFDTKDFCISNREFYVKPFFELNIFGDLSDAVDYQRDQSLRTVENL